MSQKNKSFYRRLKYTFAPEESFFATIVMNSSIAKNVIDDNLRYIDWRGTKDGHPNVLDQSNWFGIITSDAIFCRKIDGIESVQVKDNIKNTYFVMSVPTLILKWCLANKINSRTFFRQEFSKGAIKFIIFIKS